MVRRGYEALNQLDIPAWLEDFHPDVEAHDLPVVPDATVARGHDDPRRWVEMMLEIWEDGRYEPDKFTEAVQFVIAAVRAQARGRRSAVPMDVRMFHVFEMREGRVQRMPSKPCRLNWWAPSWLDHALPGQGLAFGSLRDAEARA